MESEPEEDDDDWELVDSVQDEHCPINIPFHPAHNDNSERLLRDELRSDDFYSYSPLKDGNSIRLIELKRSPKPDDMINCAIIEASLDDTPEYWTLSYAWGITHSDGSHLSEFVICDGRCLAVTPNLNAGLKRVREHWTSGKFCGSSEKFTLWVDAVCINQSDDAERSQQVMLMRETFSRCSGLLVWLGAFPGEEDGGPFESYTSSLVLEMFTIYCKALHNRADTQRSEITTRRTASKVQNRSNASSKAVQPARSIAAPWLRFVQSFLSRPWFQRRWVVQEVYLASQTHDQQQRLCILYGNQVYRGLSVARAFSGLRQTNVESQRSSYRSREQSIGPLAFLIGGDRRHHHLLWHLERNSSSLCADDRDRIYALLGTQRSGRSDMTVDYSKSVEAVYLEFAMKCLRWGLFHQLLACAIGRRSYENAKLPSWVPDWRMPAHYPVRELERLGCLARSRRHINLARHDGLWHIGPDMADAVKVDLSEASTYQPKSGSYLITIEGRLVEFPALRRGLLNESGELQAVVTALEKYVRDQGHAILFMNYEMGFSPGPVYVLCRSTSLTTKTHPVFVVRSQLEWSCFPGRLLRPTFLNNIAETSVFIG